jgi:hypothetical protein
MMSASSSPDSVVGQSLAASIHTSRFTFFGTLAGSFRPRTANPNPSVRCSPDRRDAGAYRVEHDRAGYAPRLDGSAVDP